MSTLNQLKRPATLAHPYRRVGRGQSSTRGKQSGRGGKGQTARAGNKRRPELRDIIKKLPKRRGYGKNRGRTVDGTKPDMIALSIERLNVLFDAGAEVTPQTLQEKGILKRRTMLPVKIVGGEGESKKFSIKGIAVTASARAMIEKAGGTIVLPLTGARAAKTPKVAVK